MELPSVFITALPWVQWALALILFFVSGIAWCFNLWVVPIIRLNRSTSAMDQMTEMSRRGGIWLEPFNALLAALLALTALVTSQHHDSAESAAWKYYAAASFTLLQVAWWERLTVFPLDDDIVAMKENGRRLGKAVEKDWLQEKALLELWRTMDRWAVRHAVRAALPVVAAFIAVSPKVLRTLS